MNSSEPAVPRSEFSPAVAVGAVIVISTLVRIFFILTGQLNLSPDEAQYWDWSRTLDFSYYSKGPLVAYLIRFWTMVFGSTEFGVRIGAVANVLAAQLLLWWGIGRLWKRPHLALWTLILANTMPLFLAAGLLMTTDNPLVVCWIGALFMLYRLSTEQPRIGDALLLGLFLGLGILAKYIMLAFVPLAMVYGLILGRKQDLPQGFWNRLCLGICFGLVLGLAPILIWNIKHDWVGFRHVAKLGGVSSSKSIPWVRFDVFAEHLGSQILLFTPWWFVFLCISAWRLIQGLMRREVIPYGLEFRQGLLLILGFAPLWVFFFLWSFHTRIYANWPAVSYATGMILAALALEALWKSSEQTIWRRLTKAWLALGVILFLLGHTIALAPVPEKYSPWFRLSGWQDLGAQVDEMKKRHFQDPSRVFLLSDAYGVTAELAFYTKDQRRAFCVDEGRRMNQYDIWPGPENLQGYDAIYIRKDWKRSMTSEVGQMFERVGGKVEVLTRQKGVPARRFTLFYLYGYNGHWPMKIKKDF